MKLKKWNFKLLALILTSMNGANAQDHFIQRLLPHHVKLQFAGGTGFFSMGAGYINKKQWLETDVYYGYVPKSIGGMDIHQLTGKLSAFPLEFRYRDFFVKPISIGLLVNYTFGKQYFGFTPENYPFDYYAFPTSLHAGGFFGGQVNKRLKRNKIRQLGLYYEVITFDSELISYINNRNTLKISDIINIGIGMKATIR